jgi:repressor LexA
MNVRDQMACKLREFRKASGLSVDEVGSKIGKSGKTISAWEVGHGQPGADLLIQLCGVYGVHISDFYGSAIKAVEGDYTDIPLYGSIAAGTPIEMLDVDDTYPVPTKAHKQYPKAFLLKVDGESMNRTIPNGCYALVDPEQKDDVCDGKPYAVCVNGFDATIKRIRKLANGFELVPDSNDPTYKATIYDFGIEGTETITVIGRVVWYTIPLGFEL